MRCERSHDDAAYVLGALTPSEHRAYLEHLGTCGQCRAGVAELAGLPGLMRAVDSEVAQAIHASSSGPVESVDPDSFPSPLPGLLAAAARWRSRQAHRRRWQTGGVAVVAGSVAVAACVAVTAVIWPEPQPSPAPDAAASAPPMTAMAPVSDKTRVSAEIALSKAAEGTLVRMRCWYPPGTYYQPAQRWQFVLVAISASGETERIASWSAGPSDRPHISVTTGFSRDELDRVEIRRPDGAVMLRHRL